MPVKIIDLELSEPVKPVWGMEGYEGLSLLVRYHGKPVGWAYTAGFNCSFVSSDRIMQAIDSQISWQCVEAVLGEGPSVHGSRSEELPPISVIVCCGDSTKRFEDCLTHLRKMEYREYEIIVIDYGIRGLPRVSYTHGDVRYVRVDGSNLAIARNRGIVEARHSILAFIDPDSYPDHQWLSNIGHNLSSHAVKAVCGLVIPAELDTDPQFQFEHGGYGSGRGLDRKGWRRALMTDLTLVGSEKFGSGGNMAFHRSVLDELGGFDPRFGVDLVSGGCEVELLHRLVANGHTLLYEPKALTWHRPKRDLDSVRKVAFDHGRSTGIYLWMCVRKRTVGRYALMRFLLRDWGWRRILRRLVRPGKATRSLVAAEVGGLLASPFTFWTSRKKFGSLAKEANAKSIALRQSLTKRNPEFREIASSALGPPSGDTGLTRIKIVRTWYPHWGAYSGINQYLKYLNPDAYHTTTVLVREDDSQFPVRNPRFREWIRYWSRRDDMAWYNLSDLRAEFSIFNRCVFERPDVVHYLDGEHAAQWIPRLSCLPTRMRPRFVVSYHQPPDVMASVIRKDTVRHFDRVIAVAPEQVEFLHQLTSPARVNLILHGIDTQFFRPSSKEIAESKIRCISVGYNYRDYRTVRQVAIKLQDHAELEFHIVSHKATGLEDLRNVVIHRHVDDLGLLKLYQNSDILFLPLLKATANNALLEGIACGLPVISTLLPSVKAYLPGAEALLIDTNDPSDYADAVSCLSQDFRRRQEMGKLARQRAEELSWSNVTAQYEAMYSELAGR